MWVQNVGGKSTHLVWLTRHYAAPTGTCVICDAVGYVASAMCHCNEVVYIAAISRVTPDEVNEVEAN
jgi:hypothetical protein